jgi:predicted phosphate transport protein (TIGR00153 family)
MKQKEIYMKIFKDHNKELELEMDLYLNSLQKSSNTFLEGVKAYLREVPDQFEERIKYVTEQEKESDEHLVNIKYVLFRYNLVPDLSADILELMDSMDDIADISKESLLDFQVVKPDIPKSLSDDFGHIAKKSNKAVETLIQGVRIYLTEFSTVEDYITKTYLFESDVDTLLHNLKLKIFDENLDCTLGEKLILNKFADKLAELSDIAEKVASKLSVFRFKRSI